MSSWEDVLKKADHSEAKLKRVLHQASRENNVQAFLDMIAFAELGDGLLEVSDDGYNVLVGSTAANPKLFDDYSVHPFVNRDPVKVFGSVYSTAAGRYQFLSRYWDHYRKSLELKDFGPESQDVWATQLIREQGALADVTAGNIETAVRKCNNIWASLPGNDYGQPQHNLGDLTDVYEIRGGTLNE